MLGRLRVGTSGFAYPGWVPRFYPPDLPASRRLEHYAARMGALELNNTFYRSPTPAAVAGWVAATPPDFRFAIKAQRGGSYRALQVDPTESVPWLTAPYRDFGERLGTVLFRVPEGVPRNDARLGALLAAWPPHLPLTLEFQDKSWHVDETFGALANVGAALCTTELPEDTRPPTIRRTGSFLYLRLRRTDYGVTELEDWARRLEPFLRSGVDVYAFFRHDETGRGPELGLELEAAVGRVLAA